MDFYYQIGEFSTTTIWGRPSWMKIRRFLLELKKTEIYNKYKIIIYGGIMYDINNTWDLDIQLVSENLDSYEELEKDLYFIYDIALNKHRLLVDAGFFYKEWNPNITKTDFYSNNYDDIPFDFIKIGYIKKIMDGQIEEHDRLEKGEDFVARLTKYLVKRSRSYPSCLNKKGHARWFKHENSKKFYTIDEFLDDTDVDFFNKTNK